MCSKRSIEVEFDETDGVSYFIPDEEITNATEAIDKGLTTCLTIGISDLRIGMISANKEYNFICEMINRYKTCEKK